MAFTNYKTWSVGETLTAANFNEQIRDNGNAMGPHLIARKTADEAVVNTTLQDDDDLKLTVAANEVWLCQFNLIVSGPAAADFKMGFTFPSGSVAGSIAWVDSVGAMSHHEVTGASPATFTPTTFGILSSSVNTWIPFSLIYIGGGTGGTLQLQWAQATASGTTNMKAQSTLYAVKLA